MTMSRAAVSLGCLTLMCVAIMSCKPKRYNVVPKGELHTHMWRIQAGVDKLDRLMKKDPKQREVIAVLADIAGAARPLTTVKIKLQHMLLRGNANKFYQSVQQALKSASGDPPNYYPAGKISGACIHCHNPDGGLAVD